MWNSNPLQEELCVTPILLCNDRLCSERRDKKKGKGKVMKTKAGGILLSVSDERRKGRVQEIRGTYPKERINIYNRVACQNGRMSGYRMSMRVYAVRVMSSIKSKSPVLPIFPVIIFTPSPSCWRSSRMAETRYSYVS